jgi:hypothetical protein
MKQLVSFQWCREPNDPCNEREGTMRHILSGFLKLTVVASMLLWTSIIVTPATAADVIFNFTGLVTNSQLPSSTFFGQAIDGSLTYTPGGMPDINGASNIGRYNSVITSLNLTIGGVGGYDAILGPGSPNFVKITNFGTFDEYVIRAPIVAPTEPLVNGVYSPSSFEIMFVHFPSAFGNNATAPPTLGAFSLSPTFRLVFDNGVPKDVTGGLGTLTAVPLPPAVILFGAGLVALIGLGARNWQRGVHARQA